MRTHKSATGHTQTDESLLVYLNMDRMLPVAIMGALAGGFYLTMAGPIMAILARDLTVDVTSLALIGSMYGIAMIINGAGAPFTLRYGPVWLLRSSPILTIAGLLLLVWCPNLPVVMLGAALSALGTSVSSIVNPAMFPGKKGVRYVAIATGVASSTSIATTVIFAVAEWIAPGSGRFALLLMVIPSIVLFVQVMRFPTVALRTFLARRMDPAFNDLLAAFESAESSAAPEAAQKPEKDAKPTKSIVAFQVVRMILIAGVEFAFYAWGVERLRQVGVSLATASALATLFAIGMAVGRTGGARFLANRWAAYAFETAGLIGAALTGFGPNPVVVSIGLLVAGLGVSCLFPIGATDYSGLPGIVPRKATATINILSGTGALVIPLALGWILAVAGLQVGFGLLIVMFAALLVIPRPR